VYALPLQFTVLYEDNHLLVVSKPAGLATMGTRSGRPTLLAAAKDYIRAKYSKPGNVYLGIVSRLDAPVTGVVVIARTSKAAARLTDQFRRRAVTKVYWALVEGRVAQQQRRIVCFLRKDERHRRMHVATENAPGARKAILNIRVLQRWAEASLLEATPVTGRKHQIRVQLADAGHPILGDRKYGGRRAFPSGVALHSRALQFEHPVRKERLRIEAPLPSCWLTMGIADDAPD